MLHVLWLLVLLLISFKRPHPSPKKNPYKDIEPPPYLGNISIYYLKTNFLALKSIGLPQSTKKHTFAISKKIPTHKSHPPVRASGLNMFKAHHPNLSCFKICVCICKRQILHGPVLVILCFTFDMLTQCRVAHGVFCVVLAQSA